MAMMNFIWAILLNLKINFAYEQISPKRCFMGAR